MTAETPRGTHRCGTLRRAVGRDGNPLCRPVDRARSRLRLVLAAGLFAAVLAGLLVALSTLAGLRADARAVAPHRHPVSATTLAAATGAAPASTAPARAVWTFPAGDRHQAVIQAPVGTPAGAAVPTWVDDRGDPAAAPAPDSRLAATAALYGASTLSVATVLVCTGCLVRGRTLDRRAERAWEPEWQRVEPGWSGRGHPAGA